MNKNLKDQLKISIQKQLIFLTKKKFSKSYIDNFIIPIFDFIIDSKKKKFIISGSQGVGKTTLLKILEKNIRIFYKKKILNLSLDDYYLSKEERIDLSKNKHSLLITRGVPGTHDIHKLNHHIENFEKKYYPFEIPIFDKINDKRSNKKRKVNCTYDILILEGWCCGSPPLKKEFLRKNLNKLEKNYDKDFLWRNFYNFKLKNEYKKLFQKFEKIIYLKPPSFSFILDWRLKQEKMMEKNKKTKGMKKKEIHNFIQHYEKITKWMMKVLPKSSHLTILISKNHRIYKIFIN